MISLVGVWVKGEMGWEGVKERKGYDSRLLKKIERDWADIAAHGPLGCYLAIGLF